MANNLFTTGLSASTTVHGTATFSSDVYTFTPIAGSAADGMSNLLTGSIISLALPSGSANTTTTPAISYNGTSYTIKWIDGSALAVGDLDDTYNKQNILFKFDGTDMLIASEISGSNADGEWVRYANGNQTCKKFDASSLAVGSNSTVIDTWTLPKTFLDAEYYTYATGRPDTSTDFYGCIYINTGTSTTQSAPVFRNGATAQNIVDRRFFAKGRWY